MADTLNELRDIHLPPHLSWWPLAPGYFIIMFMVALLFVWGIVHYRNRHTRNIKKKALRQLAHYQHDHEQTPNAPQTAAHLSLLLKQVALLFYPRETVASLQGDAWIRFLTKSSKRLNFDTVRHTLIETPFLSNTTDTMDPLFTLTKAWIKQRRGRCLN